MSFKDCNNKAVVIITKMFLEKENVNFPKMETWMGHLLLMYLHHNSISVKTQCSNDQLGKKVIISLNREEYFTLYKVLVYIMKSKKVKQKMRLNTM